jgi:tetratricopeptide (TPR) repeat protein
MSYKKPEELIRAENLFYDAKIEEVLELITDLEKEKLIPEHQLSVLLLKGKIHATKSHLKEAEEIGKHAYKMSLNLGMIPGTIESLILQSNIMFLGKFDEALDLLLKAENLFNSLNQESPSNLLKLKAMILGRKSWVYWFKNEIDDALELTVKCKPLVEELGIRMSLLSIIYYRVISIYLKQIII